MASHYTFSASDAKKAIQDHGIYAIQNPAFGDCVAELERANYATKSPEGIKHLALNSLLREDIKTVLKEILGELNWGLIKIYSAILPSDYMFRLHNAKPNKGLHTILVLLWSPNSEVTFYTETQNRPTKSEPDVTGRWGLLATKLGKDKGAKIKMMQGGLVLVDSRVGFTISSGISVWVGCTTETELQHWGLLDVPHSDELKRVGLWLKENGIHLNVACMTEADQEMA
ncbi:hypothetical protein BGZ63DRAFT_379468 [Mariannaea sp. PMI_226]|nr:hypothetical protein BGZ63DRAFT_379468 [Mariannaea sp. PMI_226]